MVQRIVRILDLFCGTREPPVLNAAYARHDRRYVSYVGIDGHVTDRWLQPYSPSDRVAFHRETLDLADVNHFQKQLVDLLHNRLFDEIHAHMKGTAIFASEDFLPVLSKFLASGGRLFHLVQNASPILPIELDHAQTTAWSDVSTVVHRNRDKAAEAAVDSGLTLMLYGYRPLAASNWNTLSGHGRETRTDLDEAIGRVVRNHTNFNSFANHFFVFRKPKTKS